MKPFRASNSSELAFPKGPTRDQEKGARLARQAAVIRAVRAQVWALTACCAVCGDTERESRQKQHGMPHEMHEDPSRAMTRGLPPEERFTLAICMRLCHSCHCLYTANKVRCHALTDRGWAGSYDVQIKTDGVWTTVLRVSR